MNQMEFYGNNQNLAFIVILKMKELKFLIFRLIK